MIESSKVSLLIVKETLFSGSLFNLMMHKENKNTRCVPYEIIVKVKFALTVTSFIDLAVVVKFVVKKSAHFTNALSQRNA